MTEGEIIKRDINRIKKAIHYISLVECFRLPTFECYKEYVMSKGDNKHSIVTIDPLRMLYMMLYDHEAVLNNRSEE